VCTPELDPSCVEQLWPTDAYYPYATPSGTTTRVGDDALYLIFDGGALAAGASHTFTWTMSFEGFNSNDRLPIPPLQACTPSPVPAGTFENTTDSYTLELPTFTKPLPPFMGLGVSNSDLLCNEAHAIVAVIQPRCDADRSVTVSTCLSADFDTAIQVLDANFDIIAENDDGCDDYCFYEDFCDYNVAEFDYAECDLCTARSQVTFVAPANQGFYVVLSGYDCDIGTASVDVAIETL